MPATVSRKDFLKDCLFSWGGLLVGLGRLIGGEQAREDGRLQPEPPRHSVKRHG
jgi:hypothetical protein